MLKKLFHVYNSILLILYLYPGSILGFLFYKDVSRQPEFTPSFFSVPFSLNHFYAFLMLSIGGYLAFRRKKILILYLILTPIILELSHLLIPNRSFQFYDLFGNVIGALIPISLSIIRNIWKQL